MSKGKHTLLYMQRLLKSCASAGQPRTGALLLMVLVFQSLEV